MNEVLQFCGGLASPTVVPMGDLTTLLRCPDSPSTRTRSRARREDSQVMLPVPYSRRAVDAT